LTQENTSGDTPEWSTVLHRQFDRHDHRIEARRRDDGKHLGHDTIASSLAQQAAA
jgi:hypothetical protein